MLILILFLSFFLISLLFFYFIIFKSKFLKIIHAKNVENLVIFTYDFEKEIIKFNFPNKPLLFNSVHNISLNNFLSLIVSSNYSEIKMIFSNSKNILHLNKKFLIKIKINKEFEEFIIGFKTVNKKTKEIYGFIKKANKLQIEKKQKSYKKFLKIENKSQYADYILKTNSLINQKIKNNHFFYTIKLLDHKLLVKYYGNNVTNYIIFEIEKVLRKSFKKHFAICIINFEKFLIYHQTNLDTNSIHLQINNVYKKLDGELKKFNISFSLTLLFGVFFTDNIKNISLIDCESYSESALITAKSSDKHYYCITDNDIKVNNNLNVDSISPNLQNMDAENQIVKTVVSAKAEKVSFYFYNLFHDSLKTKQNINFLDKDISFKSIAEDNMKPYFETCLAYYKNTNFNSKNILFLRCSFQKAFHNINSLIANINSLKLKHLVICLFDYSSYKYEQILLFSNKLKENKIHFAFENFKFFNNYFLLVNLIKPNFILWDEMTSAEIGITPPTRSKIENLIYSTKNNEIEFICYSNNNKELDSLLYKIGIKYLMK